MPTLAYRTAVRVAHRLPLPAGKLAESLAGRRGAAARWRRWADRTRHPGPLLWVHAASVGELMTALPVMTRLRTAVPELELVLSHSSPSVARWPHPVGARYVDYVPIDAPDHAGQVFDALRPTALLFARGDLWPELVTQADLRGVAVTVCGAAVRPNSRRLRWPARVLLSRSLRAVKWLGAISQDDADRWIRLGVPPGAVAVTGDPRHDAVIERVPSPAGLEPLRAWRHAAAVMVAGSTHRSDEGVLLDAAAVLTERPDAKLLVVPHEPNATTLNRILSGAVHRGVRASPWRSGDPAPDASVVVVNAMGLLFDVYALANSVYVGGGFDRAGLHSSIEPAGFGLPLIFGPEWKTSLDAARLVASGGAVALPRRGAGTALAAIWRRWFDDPQEAAAAGLAARGVLMEGAAGSTARAVLRLIAGG